MAAGHGFAFGPYRLDVHARQLLKDDEPVALSARHLDLLAILVSRAGQVLSKDQLIEAAWKDVAVTDNSLEQAISALRKLLGPDTIQTQARRGYRFSAPVTRYERRESDDMLDALLAPHRAWIEGRAALETLERDQIRHAREVFERVLAVAPEQASAHVGLANACVMQFEMTRAEARPDLTSLQAAATHAREACRLDPQDGEAWATLGFVLERTGRHDDALAAARRSVTLEPDNWRHHLRLSYGSWGEERLRAARRTLALLPGFPLAHWLAASVHIAREALADAERELRSGIATQDTQQPASRRFSGIALHWLLGLVLFARDDDREALVEFERELSSEDSGHLYARECCANTWYAIGAMHLARGRRADAQHAFSEVLGRLPTHPLARVGLALIAHDTAARQAGTQGGSAFDTALADAAALVAAGEVSRAADLIDGVLTRAPAGNAGWLLPVEPLLRVHTAPDTWAGVLGRLRARAV